MLLREPTGSFFMITSVCGFPGQHLSIFECLEDRGGDCLHNGAIRGVWVSWMCGFSGLCPSDLG